MRFMSIKSYKKAWGEYAIQEHIDNLVDGFEAKQWRQCCGYKLSMVERFLTEGNTQPDFHNDFGEFGYHQGIDHAAFIRRTDGRTFVLTMPYDREDSFYKGFNESLKEYQAKKAEIRDRIEEGYGGDYRRKAWRKQICSDVDIRAVVVDNRYKIRENGDMVAVIATAETLREMGLC
jgi:hypothetical protein